MAKSSTVSWDGWFENAAVACWGNKNYSPIKLQLVNIAKQIWKPKDFWKTLTSGLRVEVTASDYPVIGTGMKRSIDISKKGIRFPAQVGVCSPSSRRHSEAVDAGAWNCKGSLNTLVRGCKQDAKVRWLVKVNLIESLSGKALRNLDLWPGLSFQVSVPKSVASCVSNPVLPIPNHFETSGGYQQVVHSVASLPWLFMVCCLFAAWCFQEKWERF